MPRRPTHINFILALSETKGYVVSVPVARATDKESIRRYCSTVMERYCQENRLDFVKNNTWESFASIPQSFLAQHKIRMSRIDTGLCFAPTDDERIGMPPNTRLTYAFENKEVTHTIKGRLSPEDKTTILKACRDHCRFVPEKVCLPEDGTCELYVDFATPTHQMPDTNLTTEELVSLFEQSQKTDWQ